MHGEIAECARRHRKGVGRICVGRTDVTHATAETEATQDAVLEGVVSPARRQLARRVGRYLADQGRIGIRTVEQVIGGERADDLEARSQIGDGFEFEAARRHLGILHLQVRRDAVRIGRQHILPLQVEIGEAEVTIEAGGLKLDADLGLFAGFGQQQLTGRVSADDRIIAGGIRHVRCDAAVEVVDQAGATRELAVAATERRGTGDAADVVDVDPVVTARQHQREAVKLDLVLDIDTKLLLRQLRIAIGRGGQRRSTSIDRVQHVDRRISECEGLGVADRVIFQVEAEQRGVAENAGVEAILDLAVHLRLIGDSAGAERITREVTRGLVGVAVAGDAGVVHVDMREACILAECDTVGQLALELVAEHFLLALELVEIRLTTEEAGGNAAERSVGHRADIGQELRCTGLVIRRRTENGQRGVDVRLPGHRWRDEIVVVRREVGLRSAILHLADDAGVELAIARRQLDRRIDIEAEIGVAEIIDAGFDVADRLRLRHLADDVDETAGARTTIQDRRGTAQNLDALHVEWLQLPACIGRVEQLHAVEKHAVVVRLEAADQEPVVAEVGAECAGRHAGHIAQHVVEATRLLIADLF